MLAIGNGKVLNSREVRALGMKVGDKMLFGKYAGAEIMLDGDELVVMREDDVMKIVDR